MYKTLQWIWLGVPGEHILTAVTCSDVNITVELDYFWILICISVTVLVVIIHLLQFGLFKVCR